MAQPTSFGSDKSTSFGGSTSPSFAGGEGALGGPTMFSGKAAATGGKAYTSGSGGGQPEKARYSKDYGIRVTKDQLSELQAADADFEQRIAQFKKGAFDQVGKAQSTLASQKMDFNKRVQTAQKEIQGAKSQVKNGWNQVNNARQQATVDNMFNMWWKNNRKPVTVMGGDGKGQGTYYLPQEAIAKLEREQKLSGRWIKGKYAIDATQGGRVQGQELHDALLDASNPNKLKSQFGATKEVQQAHAKVWKDIKKAERELSAAERQLAQAEAKVMGDTAKGEGDIRKADFEIDQGKKDVGREEKRARTLAKGQKEDRAKAYEKWREARAKAYAVLGQMKGGQ